ncbi:amidohydrolase family protein [Rhodococcus sp. X156]|uniref:amidohydrolase family protein n=1 Tax=Rhodococcus sp. X156 TaxID=2499145 RepID=UPI000FDB4404|nr:amidohydrolase family protein [Rhodococcus sp. X156]
MTSLLLRDCEVDGQAGVDVHVVAGVVAEVGRGLQPTPGRLVVDVRAGALLPGLADHHLHLHALTAHAQSVRCGRCTDATGLARALHAAAGDPHGWVRGVGYHEGVAGDLDRDTLDALCAQRPVRLQHRSGALWVLNNLAAAAVGLDTATHPGVERDTAGRPTGRVWRADDWLRERLPASGPPPLSGVGADLSRLGITAVTDASPDLTEQSVRAIAEAVQGGQLPQRVQLLGAPTGMAATERLTVGPYKIVLADSGLPEPSALAALVTEVHGQGRPIAAHCVSREALLILLAALEEVGARPGDRVEHAALVPVESLTELRRHGLRVITQPGFLADRGDDYLAHVDARDLPDLYRCRTLLDAGVPLALSSDAPYGPLDPWAALAAAVTRRAESGAVVGAAERLTPAEALAGYLGPLDDPGGPARRVRPGVPADLVLLHAPLAEVLAAPRADAVRMTLVGGERVFG